MLEQRPVYRIAVAGLDPRDVRLIEIVFRHSQYNRFEFVLDDGSDPHMIDVLLVDTAAPEGLQAVSAVRRLPRHVPVVAAVGRGVPSPARHAISIDRLTLQLLPILNRVVESELLSPETQPMTMPLPEGEPPFGNAASRPAAATARPVEPAPRFGVPAAPLASTRPAPAARPVAQTSPPAAAAKAPAGRPASPAATSALPAAAAAPSAVAAGQPVAARPPQPASSAAAISQAAPTRAQSPGTSSSPDVPAQAPSPAAGTRVAAIGRRPRILVVDDSPTVRQQLGIAFTRMGFVCEMVGSGEQALARLAAGQYHLVMADVMIPDLDGYRLTREIRRRHRGTPVIILSSRGSPFDHARGRLAGCKAYLAKPVPLRELEAAMLKVLRKSLPADDLAELLRNAAAARAAATAARNAAPAAAARTAAPPAPAPAQAAQSPAAQGHAAPSPAMPA
ncbi:response regulator [Burkholderiaceae bacterium FT117]|uniref:response regulator transcription factor n=1 Tax=Zeimonas sediminis TaxID=2944268 RepID=UPI0023430113|nr:response regulator [Zeimonas sediminis]MCM5571949.1 response regulator [Zeimonas sediminis]